MKKTTQLRRFVPLLSVLAVVLVPTLACEDVNAPNSQPNPYRTVEGWAQLPTGRTWGASSAVEIDRDGESIWVAERCGANTCAGSNLDPILKFDSKGGLVRSFGAGMFIFPHGIYVDRDGNVWVTDAHGQNGIGHQVFKFNPEGKLLMTLGKKGVEASGAEGFNQPNDVVVAPNGDIFVSESHKGPGYGNARITKFSKDGKFIKEFGKHGTGPCEFEVPHALAMDSRGRLFVGDRANNRIQILDQEGNFLAEWKQFGRPSGIYIDKIDIMYVADSESMESDDYKNNPGWKRGIRIGSVKDGTVTAFIPGEAEGVAADAKGNIYGAEVSSKSLKKYVKE
jgi:sugar lactone lactonase YvrE